MPKALLTRKAHFCASHRLHVPSLSDAENQEIFGKCNNPNGHGHNYELEVSVYGEIDPVTGMVMNLRQIKTAIEKTVMEKMDHKDLNSDVSEFANLNPTAENIAVVIWNCLEKELGAGSLSEIKLYETQNNSVIYRGE